MATVVGRQSQCRWDRSLTPPPWERTYAGRIMNMPPDPDRFADRHPASGSENPERPGSLRTRILESVDDTARDPAALTPPPQRWYRINVILAIGCALLTLMDTASGPTGLLDGFGTLGGLMVSAALAFRMHQPRWSLALAVTGGVVLAAFIHHPTAHAALIPVIVYSMARWADVITRRVTQGVMVLGSAAAAASWTSSTYYGSNDLGFIMVGCAMAVASAYLLGRTLRQATAQRTERTRAAEERSRHEMVEREQQLRMNAIHERNRIARELHDIIAHSLSVIVVQAEGGKAVAEKNPELARQALTTIADTSRTSLAEMRSMVRLLRGETDEGEDYVPAPGLGDIPSLVEVTGNATLVVEGDMPTVSDGIGLAAYRVVQESLTNVLKHGGPQAHATVTISYWPGEIQLEIADNGRGAAAANDGQGNGVQGMRERLELHGGQLIAQPRVGGGFVVRARLPYA